MREAEVCREGRNGREAFPTKGQKSPKDQMLELINRSKEEELKKEMLAAWEKI